MCAILNEESNNCIMTSCFHYFDKNAFDEYLKYDNVCPICRTKLLDENNNTEETEIIDDFDDINRQLNNILITQNHDEFEDYLQMVSQNRNNLVGSTPEYINSGINYDNILNYIIDDINSSTSSERISSYSDSD